MSTPYVAPEPVRTRYFEGGERAEGNVRDLDWSIEREHGRPWRFEVRDYNGVIVHGERATFAEALAQVVRWT